MERCTKGLLRPIQRGLIEMTKIKHSILTSVELDNGMKLTLSISQKGIQVSHKFKKWNAKLTLELSTWENVLKHLEDYEKKKEEELKEKKK